MTDGMFDMVMGGFEYKSTRRGRRGSGVKAATHRKGGRVGLSTLDANTMHKHRQEDNKSSSKKSPVSSKIHTPCVDNTPAQRTKRTHRLFSPATPTEKPSDDDGASEKTKTVAKPTEKRKSIDDDKDDRDSRRKRARYSESDLDTNTQLVKHNARLSLEVKTLSREAKALRHRLRVCENTAQSAVEARLRSDAAKVGEAQVHLQMRISSLEDEKVQIQDKVFEAEQTIASLRQRVSVLEAEAKVLENAKEELEAEKEELHATATELFFACEGVLNDCRTEHL